MELHQRFSALANESRIEILRWLGDPSRHFPPQVHGDIEDDGVCGVFIAQKLCVSQPTASAHLKLLVEAGFVRAKRLGRYTYFKRIDTAFSECGRDLSDRIQLQSTASGAALDRTDMRYTGGTDHDR